MIYPPVIEPVYLVRHRRRDLGGEIGRQVPHRWYDRGKCFPRKSMIGELAIVESRATLDPIPRGVKGARMRCRYYSVKGSGRDWDLDEMNYTRADARKEYAHYMMFTRWVMRERSKGRKDFLKFS